MRHKWRAGQNFSLILTLLAMSFGLAGAQSQNQPGDSTTKHPEFEVASIRMIAEKDLVPLESPISPPGAGLFTMREVTLPFAIAWAFGLDQDQLAGGPEWLNTQYYEISAKPGGDAGGGYDQLKPLVQKLLQDRFHLAYHRETENRKGYALVAAKGGPKLKASKEEGSFGYIFRDRIRAQKRSVDALAGMLQLSLGEPVVNRTGLKGEFDFDIRYAPMDATDSSLPSIFTTLYEQLGLKLKSTTVPVEMLVIDHVEKVPTEN